jgi:hypothetical protein
VPQKGYRGDQVHLGFPDPARTPGAEDEVMAAFRQVRDDIARRVPDLLKDLAVA